MLSYEKVARRFGAAKANKKLWETHIRDCYDYALPERNTIDKYMPGQKKRNKIFDDTAVDGLDDYANRMVSELVPSGTQWLKLEAGTDIPKEKAEDVNRYLEETTDVLFQHLDSSNFTSQISESFLDLGISTGAIIISEGDGIQSSLNFRAVSLSNLILERSSRGTIETVFREFKVPVADIKHIWKEAKLTQSLEEMERDKPEQEISLIEAVLENGSKYESVLMYTKEKEFLYSYEVEYNPFIVFREVTIPGEVYGRGRTMRQLNNIKTLNKMVEDYLKGLSFQANPIFTAQDDGIINPYTIQLKPGVVTPVGSNDRANPTLNSIPLSGNPQLMDFAIKNYQDQIRRAFLSKPFGSIEETPVRTATEMSIRNADMVSSTLAASSRVQSELLERVASISLHILKKAGKVADFKVNGKEVKIKLVNPSTRQQDESELAAYGRFMEFMGMFPPEVVAQKIKVEELPVSIYDTLGLPEANKRSEDEIERVQKQQAEMEQAQLQGGPQ